MPEPWQPKWWSNLNPDELEHLASEFGWLLRVLEMLMRDASQLDKTKLNVLLGWAGDAVRRKRILAVLQAAEVCQQRGETDLTIVCPILKTLLSKKAPLEEDDLRRLLNLILAIEPFDPVALPCTEMVAAYERWLISNTSSTEVESDLSRLKQKIVQHSGKASHAIQKLLQRIERLANDSPLALLHADNGYADMLRQHVTGAVPEDQVRWEKLLRHAATVLPEPPATQWEVTIGEVESRTGVNVVADDFWSVFDSTVLDRCASATWHSETRQIIGELDASRFFERLTCWFLEVLSSKPGYLVRQSMNRELLRGLLWCCVGQEQSELTRAIRMATEYFYANNSPLAVAGLQVLIRLRSEGLLDELARIAGAVKAKSQQRLVLAARQRIASQLGTGVDELDDPILPTMDLAEVGKRREVYSGYTVELLITGPQAVSLQWYKPDGSPQKTLPAKVQKNHPREVTNLKDSVKGIRQTLSLASAQLESSLLTAHTWKQEAWRQRYFDHPVAGFIGRRLVWKFTDGQRTQVAIFQAAGMVDCCGQKIEVPETAEVSLWHPIDTDSDGVRAWREFLFERQVTQPFKQAHREVYLLTDAERQTSTYSNRFAAHLLRQPQFRALAKARGWKAPYFGHWDGGYEGVPHKELAAWNIRAEFWVDATGSEFAQAGGYLHLATDQVRFLQPLDAREPMPLSDVPPRVFTEIMRDVDLFVGVGSIGNDPNWHDGGPRGVHERYWHEFSFGQLAASAVTRKEVLERIVPRLKIADRCSFEPRFLVVRGDLRTYKIHLGSANILMEPNDQYLCIVPKRSAAGQELIFLPFEGDNTLSVILSKAFLLADDTSIKDPSIVTQIRS